MLVPIKAVTFHIGNPQQRMVPSQPITDKAIPKTCIPMEAMVVLLLLLGAATAKEAKIYLKTAKLEDYKKRQCNNTEVWVANLGKL